MPGGRRVATTRVVADGSFARWVTARGAGPGTRFQARIGSRRSQRLMLRRRTQVTSARVRGGRVVITGRIAPPLAGPREPAIVRRWLGCRRTKVVARVRTRPNGTFRASFRRPGTGHAAIFTVSSRVRTGDRTTRTFSLPLPIRLR